ncbi:MAG TPA: ATP-binding protein [Rubrobacteraceae bacterium]|nr:ATP-binding protein [Rubrobacteraceae bacterium]
MNESVGRIRLQRAAALGWLALGRYGIRGARPYTLSHGFKQVFLVESRSHGRFILRMCGMPPKVGEEEYLDLSRTDVRALLYRVFMRFQDEFADRAVSLDLEIAPEVGYAVVDKLKLREAVAELLRNALEALPETGGHLGLRSRLSEDGTELLIEVADDGAGAEQSLIDRAFEPGSEAEGRPRTGLTLTRAVVEQHGGRLGIESEPGEGTYAQIRLPLRG